jgi:hypothetical protein
MPEVRAGMREAGESEETGEIKRAGKRRTVRAALA